MEYGEELALGSVGDRGGQSERRAWCGEKSESGKQGLDGVVGFWEEWGSMEYPGLVRNTEEGGTGRGGAWEEAGVWKGQAHESSGCPCGVGPRGP